MKAAICFYGLVGSRRLKGGAGAPLPPDLAHEHYARHIFTHQDCDVFIHTWSVDHEDELRALYKPKAILAEPQRYFEPAASLLPARGWRKRLKIFADPQARREWNKGVEDVRRAYSRWYSNKMTLALMQQEIGKSGTSYDAVMVTRLDVAFFRDLKFADYDLSKFWASHWNDQPLQKNDFKHNHENHYLGKGFLDFWFFSNAEIMSRFGTLFDHITDYHPNPHRASWDHVSTITDNIGYTFYRWEDHEMVRRKFFESDE